MLIISNKVCIPIDEFEFTFVRSTGPGGQNVNKVSTKAVMRWNPIKSVGMPADMLARFLTKFQSRVTKENDIIITSDKFRVQGRNQQDCLDKLHDMLLSVLDAPKERKKTKISRSKKLKALESKRIHGTKKRLRQKSRFDE